MEKSSFVLSVSSVGCISDKIVHKRPPAIITLPDLVLTEGKNRVALPLNKGCMEFVMRGDQFTEVMLMDVAGYVTHLVAMATDFSGISSEAIIPDACFGLPDSGELVLCFCRTAGVYHGSYTITFRKAILYAL